MIDLGSTDFLIDVPSLPRQELRKYSTHLFDEWEEYVSSTLELPDYSLTLEVEEGSVKGVGRVAAVLGALYAGIATYGGFVQGIEIIRNQVSSVGDYLAEKANSPFKGRDREAKVRKRGGSLTYLQRLFIKVQRREMTIEQAMLEAESLFGDDSESAPGFMDGLRKSLEQAPLFHQQLPLLPDTVEVALSPENRRKPRPSRQLPSGPPPEHLRVEVWRDSKNGKRKVRVLQL